MQGGRGALGKSKVVCKSEPGLPSGFLAHQRMKFELKVEGGVKSILSLDFVFLICRTSSKKAIILNNIAWVWDEMHVIAKRKHCYLLVSCMSVLALLCPKSKRMTFHCLFNFDQQYITHQEKWSSHICNSYC